MIEGRISLPIETVGVETRGRTDAKVGRCIRHGLSEAFVASILKRGEWTHRFESGGELV